MNFKPTIAQKKAVEITDQSILLSAGAGSGKTRVLVQRYLHLLKARLASAEEILAITFTNKAAQEMQTRISQEVYKLASEVKSATERDFWQEVIADLSKAQITTFHGFCGQILSLNLFSGVNSSLKILDETKADGLLDEVIEDLLLTGLKDVCPNLLVLAREYGLSRINHLLKTAYLDSRANGSSLNQLRETSLKRSTLSESQVEKLKLEIVSLVEELLKIKEETKLTQNSKKKLDNLEENWPGLATQIKLIGSLGAKERKALATLVDILKGRMPKKIKQQHDRLKEIIESQLLQSLADLQANQLLSALTQIIQKIDREYTRRKQRFSALDFTDLEERALKILQTKAEVSRYFREKYQFIMVDEFQDTNPSQTALIRLLVSDNLDAPITSSKLFVVGDPKQSIYRFRGADLTVFKQLQRELAKWGQEILLDVNFRARKQIIDFVNHFFQKIFQSESNPYDIKYQESTAFRQGNSEDICVEFLLLDPAELKTAGLTPLKGEAEQIAQWIQQMVVSKEKLVYENREASNPTARPLEYGDICILFQTLSNVQVYQELLQSYQIPCMVINGPGFFQRQEIRDLVNLLQVIDNPHLQLPWAGVLRSPFCGLSDEELFWVFQTGTMVEILTNPSKIKGLSSLAHTTLRDFLGVYHNLRAQRDKLEISVLIRQLLQDTGYIPVTSVQNQGELIKANLEKVIILAREYQKELQSSLAGFMRYLEKMDQKGVREGLAQIPGQSNLVKMMTVHQAKGLEFPVVILVESQRQLINSANLSATIFDSQLGIGLRVKDPLTKKNFPTSLYLQIIEEEKKREIAERKRLFYVAATRAADYLLISGTLKPSSANEIDQAKSWLDWLRLVFDLSLEEALPRKLNYGKRAGQQIRLSFRQKSASFSEVAMTSQLDYKIDYQRWQEIYQQSIGWSRPNSLKPKLAQFTVSGLLTYQRCPRWYYYQYLEQLPPTVIATSYRLLRADTLGSLIHFICQHIKSVDELTPLIQRGIEHLELSYLSSEMILTKLACQLGPYIKHFLKGEKRLQQQIDFQRVKDWREFSFHLIVGRGLIKGTIDRVLLESDRVTIIDYKSNKLAGTEVDRTAVNYRLQAHIYALAIYQLTGIQRVDCKLHFLHPDKYWEKKITRGEMGLITDQLIELQEKIIRSQVTTANNIESFPCAHHPSICPEDKVCAYFALCSKSVR